MFLDIAFVGLYILVRLGRSEGSLAGSTVVGIGNNPYRINPGGNGEVNGVVITQEVLGLPRQLGESGKAIHCDGAIVRERQETRAGRSKILADISDRTDLLGLMGNASTARLYSD